MTTAGNSAVAKDRHPYELFLELGDIAHRTMRVKRPQSNGMVERCHRTLLDEQFHVEGRKTKTCFETVEEMRTVLDAYLVSNNERRPHQGLGIIGRTPAEAFVQGLLQAQPMPGLTAPDLAPASTPIRREIPKPETEP